MFDGGLRNGQVRRLAFNPAGLLLPHTILAPSNIRPTSGDRQYGIELANGSFRSTPEGCQQISSYEFCAGPGSEAEREF